MPDGPVVLNNTPLVALWVLDRLELLRELFGEVLIPQAVRDEFLATATAERQASLDGAAWIRIVPLSAPRRVLPYTGLDQGEAEVLALAEEHEARLVIIDEWRARRYAHRLQLPLTGTLGVILLARERGLIPAVRPLVEGLLAAGLYLSPSLVERVLELAGEGDDAQA